MQTERDLTDIGILEGDEAEDVKESDLDIIRALDADGGTLAFQGLRRKMNIHQEKLSRALLRLEEDGYIQRLSKGYALTPKGSILAHRGLTQVPRTYSTILQSFLPGYLSPQTMARHLEGRWFQNLRWLGIKEDEDRIVLRWVSELSGTEIVLHLSWGQIRIETDAMGGEPLIEALMGAQKIFGFLTEPWQEDYERMHHGTMLLEWSEHGRFTG